MSPRRRRWRTRTWMRTCWSVVVLAKRRARATALLALAALIVALTFAPGTARKAEAHAALIRSSPENGARERRPPFRVILYFSEPVESKLTSIEVFAKDRTRVDNDDLQIDPSNAASASVGVGRLAPGLYTVEFSNVSTVDGHPWRGVYQFIVLNPDGTTPPDAEFDPGAVLAKGTGLLPDNIDSALKWIALLSLATVAGAAFFALAVQRPAAAFLEHEQRERAIDAGERWTSNLTHVLMPVSFIASAVLILLAVGRFETSTGIWSYLTDVRVGQYRAVQLGLLAVALAGADVLFLTRGASVRRGALGLLALAGALALLTYSLVSHSAAAEGKFWSVASDYTHLVAASAWLGALAMLLPLLRWARRELDETYRFLFLANAFDRFSVVAGVSVAILFATGTFNGLAAIPNASALWDTTYGRVLLAKLALTLPLLVVAGLNAFILKPRLVSLVDGLYEQPGEAAPPRREAWQRELGRVQSWLPRTIALEVVLLVAVFASVSVLTQTSTAKGEIAQEEARRESETVFRDVKTEGDLTLEISIQPNRGGTINQYDLKISDASGAPVEDLQQVRMRFFYTDPSKPDTVGAQSELILRDNSGGEYTGQGAYFTQAGAWRIEAGIRREGQDDIARNFVVSVAPAEASGAGEDGGAFALPFDTFTWNEVLGVALVLLGGSIVVYRRQIGAIAQHGYRIGVSVAAALAIAGAVLWFGVDTHSAAGDPSAGNPIEPTDESIAAGRMLYQQNCIVCHGETGRGDGPDAAGLDPAPSDFRQHLPLHPDSQFFSFIANGFPGSAMPAWREQFSDDDIWNLVNYLRTFGQTPIE